MLFQSGFLLQPLRTKEPAELNNRPEENATAALEKSRLLKLNLFSIRSRMLLI